MVGDSGGEGLLAALGLRRGEAAEVLHQHLMARRARRAGGGPDTTAVEVGAPSGGARSLRPATAAELLDVLRGYASRKAAFGELVRQGKLPPRPDD